MTPNRYEILFRSNQTKICVLFCLAVSKIVTGFLKDGKVRQINKDVLNFQFKMTKELENQFMEGLSGKLDYLDDIYTRLLIEGFREKNCGDDNDDLTWVIQFAHEIGSHVKLNLDIIQVILDYVHVNVDLMDQQEVLYSSFLIHLDTILIAAQRRGWKRPR